MDTTLLTILVLLVLATALALIQARRRDRCLKGFDQFHITLAEKDGDLTWGQVDVHPSGLEVVYARPVVARAGHLERSFLFFKDQYETMDALYRFPGGLPAEEQRRRAEAIARTVKPGFGRRLWRKLRNWISMVRDALVKSAGLVLGMAKTARPGAAVLTSQEEQIKAISGEVIGHAGNAFDPLLEEHLFRQVVLEVTRGGTTRSYCGWLKDYTAQFVEVVDAYANAAGSAFPAQVCAAGAARADGLDVQAAGGRLTIMNETGHLLHVEHVAAGDWQRPVGCVLPLGCVADIALPPGEDATPCAYIGRVERIDLVVPRAHAIVRHAADGTDAYRDAPGSTSVMAELSGKEVEDSRSRIKEGGAKTTSQPAEAPPPQ